MSRSEVDGWSDDVIDEVPLCVLPMQAGGTQKIIHTLFLSQ